MHRQNLLIALGVFAVVAVAVLEIGAEVRAGRQRVHPVAVHGDVRRFAIRTVTENGVAPTTAAQRQAAEAGLAAAQRWLGRNVGAAITRPTEVLLTDHDHCARHADDPAAAGVTVSGRKICLFTADTSSLQEPLVLSQAAAHEAVHVLQFQLGCGPSVPDWLIEGMAEDLSWRTMRPRADQASLRRWAAMREAGSANHRLDYGRAMGATLELDRGRPATLVAFCRMVGDGVPWPVAFGQAFDTSPGRYTARFSRETG